VFAVLTNGEKHLLFIRRHQLHSPSPASRANCNAQPIARFIAPMVRPPTKSQRKNVSEEDSRVLLKYELLGLAVLYVAWTIYKAVMDWTDRRKERKH
jgi:hypothetical protein